MGRLLVVLALAGVGCNKDDTDTDTDVVDTDTGEDIPDTFLGFTEKPSDVERQGEVLLAGLIEVTVQAGDVWEIGGTMASGRLSGTGNFGIELPDGPPADLQDLPGGRRGRLYLPVVFDDVNRDGTLQEAADDYILGLAHDRWLAWLEPGPDALDGWVVVDRTGESWTVYPRTEQATVRLRGLSATATLEGLYTGEREAVGFVAVEERALAGEETTDWRGFSVLVEETGKFVGVADARPPIDAFQFPEGSLRYVRMTVAQFEDLDGDGLEDEGEAVLPSLACIEGAPVHLRYSDTPRSVELARELDRLGWTSGWRLVTGSYGAETELDRGDIRWASYDDACVGE